jgi:hypothetical protein
MNRAATVEPPVRFACEALDGENLAGVGVERWDSTYAKTSVDDKESDGISCKVLQGHCGKE